MPRPTLIASRTASPMNFWIVFFIGRAPSTLLMPRRTRNSNASSETVRSKSALAEPGELFAYGKPGNFPLSVRAKGPEHDFLVEAPDEFGAEKSMQFGNDGTLQRGKRKSGRTQEPLRANIARAHNVKTRQIITRWSARVMRAASSICKRRSHIRRWDFSISSNSRTPRWCCERTFPSRPGLPDSSPMNSFTLSRCRNSDMSKRKTVSSPKR